MTHTLALAFIVLLAAPMRVSGQEFVIDKVGQGRGNGYAMITLDGAFAPSPGKEFPAGTFRVDLAQPMANLALYLLEPQAADGFVGSGVFDGIFTSLGADRRSIVYPAYKYFTVLEQTARRPYFSRVAWSDSPEWFDPVMALPSADSLIRSIRPPRSRVSTNARASGLLQAQSPRVTATPFWRTSNRPSTVITICWSRIHRHVRVMPVQRGSAITNRSAKNQAVLRMTFEAFLHAFVLVPVHVIRTSRRIVFRLLAWNPWQGVLLRGADRLRAPLRC